MAQHPGNPSKVLAFRNGVGLLVMQCLDGVFQAAKKSIVFAQSTHGIALENRELFKLRERRQ